MPFLDGPRRRASSRCSPAARRNVHFDAGQTYSSARATRRTRSTSSATAASRSRRSCPTRGPIDDRDDRGRARCSAGRGSSRRTAGTSTRARSSAVRATGFDGACLRGKCDAGPRARLRPDEALRAGADRAPAVDAAPAPRRLWRRPRLSSRPAGRDGRRGRSASRERERDTADTWTLTLEPVAGDGPSIAPGQFVMVYAFGVGEVPISVSGPPDRPGAGRPHRARRRRGDRARSARPSRARCSACAARSATRGRSTRRRAATSSSSPAGSASRRSARSSCTRSSGAASTARSSLLYGARTPADLLYRDAARGVARRARRRGHRRRGRRRLDGPGRRRPEAGRRRALRPECGDARSSAGPR